MPHRRVLGPALLTLTLLVAGCSGGTEPAAAPAEPAPTTSSADPDGNAVYQIGSAELPADFPRDLPLPVGKLTSANSSGGGWVLYIESVRPGQFERVTDQLTAAGFKSEGSYTEGGTTSVTYANATWTVTIAQQGDEATGLAITYAVQPNA